MQVQEMNLGSYCRNGPNSYIKAGIGWLLLQERRLQEGSFFADHLLCGQLSKKCTSLSVQYDFGYLRKVHQIEGGVEVLQ